MSALPIAQARRWTIGPACAQTSPMRLLIYEPDHLGHHLAYLRLLLRAAADLPVETIVAVNAAVPGSEEGKAQLGEVPGDLKWDYSTPAPPANKRQSEEARAEHLLRLIEAYRPGHVWVPHVDHLTTPLGRLLGKRSWPGCEVEALLMHAGFAYPAVPLKKRWPWQLERFRLRSMGFRTLFLLDSLALDFLRQSFRGPECEMGLMPDPVDPPSNIGKAAARQLLNLPEDGRYVGCVGYVDRRKGCDLLIRAFDAAAPHLHPNDRLLFVGRLSPTVQRLAGPTFQRLKSAGRLVHIDGYVDNQRFLAGIEAMDVVATPYPRHIGSSSIVIRSAAAGRYVLGSEYGWVGNTIRQFALGETVNVSSQAAFAQAISASLDASARYVPSDAARRFVAFHAPANFAATWSARLRQRLSLPPAAGHLAWGSVTATALAATDDPKHG